MKVNIITACKNCENIFHEDCNTYCIFDGHENKKIIFDTNKIQDYCKLPNYKKIWHYIKDGLPARNSLIFLKFKNLQNIDQYKIVKFNPGTIGNLVIEKGIKFFYVEDILNIIGGIYDSD